MSRDAKKFLASCLGSETIELTKKFVVRVVKALQSKDISGSKGTWLAFLKEYDEAEGTSKKKSKTDPASHKEQTLLDFVASMLESEDSKGALQAIMRDLRKDQCDRAWRDQVMAAERGVWRLVATTQAHPRYRQEYRFPSTGEGWLCAPRCEPNTNASPAIFALDCEMCATDASERAVVSATVVDHGGCVVLDSLVRPEGAIRDLRSSIHGITHSNLEGVSTSTEDVRQRLLALLAGGGILVGHGLHHDLNALKLDYWPVVDTARLYSFRGLTREAHTPSLASLAQVVLKKELHLPGQPHSAREDATAALELTLRACLHPPEELLLDPGATMAAKEDLCKLLVHRIPEGLEADHLLAVFGEHAKVVGCLPGSSKVHLQFDNPKLADAAFQQAAGKSEQDSSGMMQKSVPVATGAAEAMVKVRRMQGHNGASIQRVKAWSAGGGEGAASGKKRNGEGVPAVKEHKGEGGPAGRKRKGVLAGGKQRGEGIPAGKKPKRLHKKSSTLSDMTPAA